MPSTWRMLSTADGPWCLCVTSFAWVISACSLRTVCWCYSTLCFVVLPDPLTAPKFHVKKLSWFESMRVPEQFPVQRCLNLSAAVAVLGEAGLLKQVGPVLPARTSLLCICLQRHCLELKRALFLWKMRRRLLGEWLGRFGLWLVSGSFRLSWRSAAFILHGR